MSFKVGDRVKVLSSPYDLEIGAIGTVIYVSKSLYVGIAANIFNVVKIDNDGDIYQLYDREIELVEGTDNSYIVEGAPSTQDLIVQECDSIKALLLEKNAKYKDSALHPVRIFSKASPEEQLRVRVDDKLSRIMNTDVDDEDSLKDLVGYLIMLMINRRVNKT